MILDSYDKKLLHELDKDATLSLKELSKVVRKSKQFVSYRLKRLENEGLILGYSAVVDVTAIGFFCFRVYVDLQHMTQESTVKFVKRIQHFPEVVQVNLLRGRYDVALYVVVPELMQFRELWDKILLEYKSQIKSHLVFTYAPIYNFSKPFTKNFRLRSVKGIGLAKSQTINSSDWKLLELYSKNVRRPYLELATELGVSSYYVKKRITDFISQGIISGTGIDLNPHVIKNKFYTISLSLVSMDVLDNLYKYCSSQKQVYQINRVIGGDDFEIKVMIKDKEELLDLIDRIKKRFLGKIKDDSYFSFIPLYSRGIVPF